MKVEGLVNWIVQLFQDMDGEMLMNDEVHIPLQVQVYPGHDEDEPITIVCGEESSAKAEASQVTTPIKRSGLKSLDEDQRGDDME